MQVFGLIGAAAAHGAALDLDGHVLRLVGALGHLLDVGLVQAQMDGLIVEHGVGGFLVQGAQQAFGREAGLGRASDLEHLPAVGDFHAQP